jgi:hypothetical protein
LSFGSAVESQRWGIRRLDYEQGRKGGYSPYQMLGMES